MTGKDARSAAWRYCVVGNIVKTHTDENGILRYGTVAYRGGAKVYLCGKVWNNTDITISVIGLNRKSRKYQVTDVSPVLIENVRFKQVYKPAVLRIMDDWEFYHLWWDNTEADRKDAVDFVARWNMT